MKIIKRTNKKFEYKPRYYKGEGNPYEIKHKFDEFRKTVGKKNIKEKFNDAVEDLNSDGKGFKVNRTILIIALILTLIFLYLIDFDLSIFQSK
ncbi:MAG: riboflavin synthase subunit beta [Flavobacteriaceae bacterium]|jgi:hypothetical protein|nr:riboflavin synthase subunit beta [Flavobacteriaceae bacterium]MCB0485933.1 riboflavin synthase subunit beta [Flavobacteriaceae bacterium]